MFRRVAIVQARMTSQRLPGKVLQVCGDRPLLDWQLLRLQRCTAIDDIWIATSDQVCDEPISQWAQRAGIPCYRGAADDVLARYVAAARTARADVVVRITADCPLIDPEVTDRVVMDLVEHAHECDYASNVLERTFPRGLDVEAFFVDALERMNRLSQTLASREHVTLAARSERPELFLTRSVRDDADNSDLRWTVDVPADLELIRALHSQLDFDSPALGYRDLVRHVRANPALESINAAAETWDPSAREFRFGKFSGGAA